MIFKKYPYRHVSITYWTSISKPQITVYDEDKDGNSPVGQEEGRCYDNATNASMLRLTEIHRKFGANKHVVMGESNVTIFFWVKRKTRKVRREEATRG